jgi:hypothetical protein
LNWGDIAEVWVQPSRELRLKVEIFKNGKCLEISSNSGGEEELHRGDVSSEDPLPDNADETTSKDDVYIREGEEGSGGYGELYTVESED